MSHEKPPNKGLLTDACVRCAPPHAAEAHVVGPREMADQRQTLATWRRGSRPAPRLAGGAVSLLMRPQGK